MLLPLLSGADLISEILVQPNNLEYLPEKNANRTGKEFNILESFLF